MLIILAMRQILYVMAYRSVSGSCITYPQLTSALRNRPAVLELISSASLISNSRIGRPQEARYSIIRNAFSVDWLDIIAFLFRSIIIFLTF